MLLNKLFYLLSFTSGMVAWQGRHCALNYNNFSNFMKHLYSQVACLPCDVHDCITCTAEAHQDFSHMEESLPNTTAEASFKRNLFPSFSASSSSATPGKSKKEIKKRLRGKQRGLSDNGSSPRALALKHIAMSTTPRIQNPYEEEFIEEIILPKEMVRFPKSAANSSSHDKAVRSSLFPYIPQSPPTRPRRMKLSGGHSRRTVSAPGVPTSSLKSLLTKT